MNPGLPGPKASVLGHSAPCPDVRRDRAVTINSLLWQLEAFGLQHPWSPLCLPAPQHCDTHSWSYSSLSLLLCMMESTQMGHQLISNQPHYLLQTDGGTELGWEARARPRNCKQVLWKLSPWGGSGGQAEGLAASSPAGMEGTGAGAASESLSGPCPPGL